MVLPSATKTEAGTLAEVELLDSFTADPPTGAGTVRVTVPVVVTPPATEVGVRLTDETAGGLTVRVPFEDPVVMVAVIVAMSCFETPWVCAVKGSAHETEKIVR